MMGLNINNYNIFLIVLVSFIMVILITPLVKLFAIRVKAMDKPDNKRKFQKNPMPRMGGLAIFITFVICYLIFAPKTTQMIPVFIGALIVLGFGIWDDIKSINVGTKLAGQIIASSIPVIFGGLTISNIHVFGTCISFGILSYPLTILFITGIINAINFADGLDGLVSGSSSIYFITVSIIGFLFNKLGGLDVILCLILTGACIGFLAYNFYPAQIYLGDTGSMFLGYIISIIALLGFKTATISSLIVPLLLLFVPIADTILAMLRRLIKGQRIGEADHQHFHHQILNKIKSVPKTVIVLYLIDILFAAVSILYTLKDKKISLLIYIILLILFIILIMKTDILFEHKKEKNK